MFAMATAVVGRLLHVVPEWENLRAVSSRSSQHYCVGPRLIEPRPTYAAP
jgi:hypothetical protein